ncbi:plasmid recombination protein, partial [Listeria monocytogenes]|nr:plasmid recombination protein [Listeria monocytogenes]EBQ6030751.1 plasmid recombination protein [Salmonella enterica subsp. enterica serovar Enteritidis]ECA6008627.1 plasmid recombination protein [Salmonella enterica subsp. enterica serovar Typhi]HDR4623471.1 plasmid recombination protein [Bacillus cereus]HEA7200708.1 plasmid recombination protein [Escherichia coli]
KKPTENVIISRTDYKKLVAAAQDNEKLKIHLKQVLNTDMAKENRELRENYEVLRGKHNDLVHRFNGMVEDHNELVQENKSLKARVSDLKREIGFVYKSAKDFLEERIRGLSAFRSAFKDLVDKVKEKTPGSEFERLHKRERRLEQNREMER